MAITKNLVNIGDANITGDLTIGGNISKTNGGSNQALMADGSVKDVRNTTSQPWFSGIPYIKSDGVMEVGKYIDFHNSNTETSDNAIRLTATTGELSVGGNFKVTGSNFRLGNNPVIISDTNNYTLSLEVDPGEEEAQIYLDGAGDGDFGFVGVRITGAARIALNSPTVQASGRINAVSGFYQTSDITKKNVLGELDLYKAYDLIDKCQTIIYSLKDDESNKEQIGLIAQEVKEFFPELITEDENGVLSLDYSRLTVVILKVLKDIIERVKKLEEK